jgi:hypothetical protein
MCERGASLDDVEKMYSSSESYAIPTEIGFNSGEALMSYVTHLFEKKRRGVVVDDDDDCKKNDGDGGGLNEFELGEFLYELFDGRRLTDNELSEVRFCFYFSSSTSSKSSSSFFVVVIRNRF